MRQTILKRESFGFQVGEHRREVEWSGVKRHSEFYTAKQHICRSTVEQVEKNLSFVCEGQMPAHFEQAFGPHDKRICFLCLIVVIVTLLKRQFLPSDALWCKERYCDRMSSVCPSVRLSVCDVDGCDHIGWNTSEIISPLGSLGCSLAADPNNMDLLQDETQEILA